MCQKMNKKCPKCRADLGGLVRGPYHAGFSNVGFAYCDTCGRTLKFGSYDDTFESIVGRKHPWVLSPEELARVEERMRPCPCGGKFRFDAFPRCPICKANIARLLPDDTHFIVLPESFDAEAGDLVWLPEKGEGAQSEEGKETSRKPAPAEHKAPKPENP
jgi:hypothetical protein